MKRVFEQKALQAAIASAKLKIARPEFIFIDFAEFILN